VLLVVTCGVFCCEADGTRTMTEREPEQQPPPSSSFPAKQKEKENFVRVDISKIRPKV